MKNIQINYFLKICYSKTHKFTLNCNSRNTNWFVDLFTQVKSAEIMAKFNLKSVSNRPCQNAQNVH